MLRLVVDNVQHYVYQIRARDDGRVVYIGQGKRERCFARHRKNPDINALIDAGGTHRPEIIAGPMTRVEAWSLEVELIAKHKRVCDGGTLLNRSTGGKHGAGGVRRSDETRAKLAAAQRGHKPTANQLAGLAIGRTRLLNANQLATLAAYRGRKHSDAAKAKMSAGRLGKKRGPMSAEARANMGAASRVMWAAMAPDARAAHRAKVSAATKIQMAAKSPAERSASASKAAKAQWDARKAAA
jgi:hypothetical protein